MALEFMDGFDHYADPSWIAKKWDGSTNYIGSFSIVSPGRFGGFCASDFQSGNGLTLTSSQLTSQATRVVGFALNITSTLGTAALLSFLDGSTIQVTFQVNANGSISAIRDPAGANVTIATSAAGKIQTNTWAYVEIKLTVGSSTGAYDVHVGGTSILSGTSANTQTSTNASSNGLQLIYSGGSTTLTYQIDDVYVLNGAGTANNTFLGECQVVTGLPNADGSNTGLTPNTGTTHYTQANEISPDSDTSYLSSATAGSTDTYKFPTLAGSFTKVAGSSAVPGSLGNVTAANNAQIYRFLAPATCTVNSLSLQVDAFAVGSHWKALLYSDASGAPGSLLAASPAVTGIANGYNTALFSTGISLTAGTYYWMGIAADSSSSVVIDLDTSVAASGQVSSSFNFASPASTWAGSDNSSGLPRMWLSTRNAVTGTIAAVQTVMTGRRDSTGSRSIAGATKSGSATTVGSAISLGSSYAMLRQVQETDPNTSAAWTATNLNAAEFGARIT